MHPVKCLSSLSQGINLAVATLHPCENLVSLNVEGIIYYLIPTESAISYQKRLEKYWEKIIREFNPDIVHIHGTEYTHGLACIRAFPNMNYIVSIQGLVGVYSKYYFGGISTFNIIKHITFRDVVRFSSMFQEKRSFEKRGNFEKEYFLKTKHVIGRTNWDFAHAKSINPSVEYHFINESLRDCFYQNIKWNSDRITNHTIFLSQATYPFKGLHIVLEAVALLMTEFPEIKIRVAGPSIIRDKTFHEKMKLSGYGSYIKDIIKKNKLNGIIHFTGFLDEEKMKEEYLNCHVFICPSSIENSPNSLGEAQILGVPIVASYVGGVPDMVEHGVTGLLYRFEETEMLVQHLRKIFSDPMLATRLSSNGIKSAERRHDRLRNFELLQKLYGEVAARNL
jgi:glycosyltransferase involved in cell wall biosynthesis